MWILYFDQVPKYRFRTNMQQVWMALHLPFHLAILGVVEGSQQLAQAYYINAEIYELGAETWWACVGEHLDGQNLTDSLIESVEYFKLDESPQGTLALPYVYQEIYALGNTSGVCSPANSTDLHNKFNGIPMTFAKFLRRAVGAMVEALNIEIPPESAQVSAWDIALESWIVVYTYFWSAIILLLGCYTITSLLADRTMDDVNGKWWKKFTHWPFRSRLFMLFLAIVMLILGQCKDGFIRDFISSGWVLPAVVLKFFLICSADRLSKVLRRRSKHENNEVTVSTELVDNAPQEVQNFGGVQRRKTNGYGYPMDA